MKITSYLQLLPDCIYKEIYKYVNNDNVQRIGKFQKLLKEYAELDRVINEMHSQIPKLPQVPLVHAFVKHINTYFGTTELTKEEFTNEYIKYLSQYDYTVHESFIEEINSKEKDLDIGHHKNLDQLIERQRNVEYELYDVNLETWDLLIPRCCKCNKLQICYYNQPPKTIFYEDNRLTCDNCKKKEEEWSEGELTEEECNCGDYDCYICGGQNEFSSSSDELEDYYRTWRIEE